MQTGSSNDNKIPVVLIDDHTIVRHAIKTTLDATKHYIVVGEGSTADEAVSLTESLKPQVILMDLGLPGKSGLEAIYELRQKNVGTRIAVLTMYEDEIKAKQAFAAGASGYILKNTPVQKFLEALEKVISGGRYLPEQFSYLESSITALQHDGPSSVDPLAELSKREREVFYLLADGMPNRVIAKKLFISPRTVETHRARVIKKLNCNSTADLIRYAIRNNLLSL
jgi:DNA-binding NarL/FixJ family response regulator